MSLRAGILTAAVVFASAALPDVVHAQFIFDNYTNGYDAGNLHYPYRRYTPYGYYDINGWHNFKYDVARDVGSPDPPRAFIPNEPPPAPPQPQQPFSLGNPNWQARQNPSRPPVSGPPTNVQANPSHRPYPWETYAVEGVPPEQNPLVMSPPGFPPRAASFGKFDAGRLYQWPYTSVPPVPVNYDGYFDSGLDYRVGYYTRDVLDAPDHNAKYQLGYQGNYH
jgi:hypothetical protein